MTGEKIQKTSFDPPYSGRSVQMTFLFRGLRFRLRVTISEFRLKLDAAAGAVAAGQLMRHRIVEVRKGYWGRRVERNLLMSIE